jgi:phage shock protein A
MLGGKADRLPRDDIKVHLAQVVEDEQRAYQRLVQVAASVIGKARDADMRLHRQKAEVQKLQSMVKQAGENADRAEAAGDTARAASYRTALRSLAGRLTQAEVVTEQLRELLDEANGNSADVREEVELGAARLERLNAERRRFLGQLERSNSAEAATPHGRGSGTATGSQAELRRRYLSVLRAAGALEPGGHGRVTTARLEEIRAAAADRGLPDRAIDPIDDRTAR